MPISKSKSSKLSLPDIAHIGQGTPAGNWFRRYWVAVSRAEDLKDIPLGVKILGEELVLFRDGDGKIGLLGMHCSHRGTSLEYGDIEANGLRCPYHGWLYNVKGHCLEQPGEPSGSTFHTKVKHLSYPVRELGGLIFSYMGPEQDDPPPLPRYSALVRQDGFRAVYSPRYFEYNWFNFFENAPDVTHASTLHTAGSGHATRTWGNNFFSRQSIPAFTAIETDYGVKVISHKPGPDTDTEYVHMMSAALPSIVQVAGRTEAEWDDERTLFITPQDDGHFVVFTADFHAGTDADFLADRQQLRTAPPPESTVKEYDRRKYMPFRGQVWKEDIVCQATQGTIGYRQGERLADSDRGVIMLRKMVLAAIEVVRNLGTPKGVLPKNMADRIVRFDSFVGVVGKQKLEEELRSSLRG